MLKMAVSFSSDSDYCCVKCFNPIFLSRDITHYAEQNSGQKQCTFLVVDPSNENTSYIGFHTIPEQEDAHSLKRSLQKEKLYCKKCNSLLGFINREVTRRTTNDLSKHFFRIDALAADQERAQLFEMIKQKFDQFVWELNAEKKERRSRRRERILQLKENIMKMSSDIVIDPQQKIHLIHPIRVCPIFKILPHQNLEDALPSNLLLRKRFLIVSVLRKNPVVTVQPNIKSCLKKHHKENQQRQISTKKSACISRGKISNNFQSQEKADEKPKVFLKLKIVKTSCFNTIFALRNNLQQSQNSPLRIFNALYTRSFIHHNFLHRFRQIVRYKKSRLQKECRQNQEIFEASHLF